jgi:LPS export ABC transporter protein LptC
MDMNVTVFFLFIFAGLGTIYLGFSPMKMHLKDTTNAPQLQMMDFSIYDLNTKGVKSIFNATKGLRYTDRYLADNVDYISKSSQQLFSITANHGNFFNHVIKLTGDVVYSREDGLIFKSNEATYNRQTGVYKTQSKYISYKNNDKIRGSKLIYNSKTGQAVSQSINAQYQLK